MSKPRKCGPMCPPRMADGSIAPPKLFNLCLLCFNTGYRIPTGKNTPTIDEWIKRYGDGR